MRGNLLMFLFVEIVTQTVRKKMKTLQYIPNFPSFNVFTEQNQVFIENDK